MVDDIALDICLLLSLATMALLADFDPQANR
jgi:hypothetical protein